MYPERIRTLCFVAFATLMMSTYAPPGEAAPYGRCPGCSYAQMKAMAEAMVPNTPGGGQVYVYNLPGNTLRHFQIECLSTTFGEAPVDTIAGDATLAPGTDAGAPVGDALDARTCSGTRTTVEIAPDKYVLKTFNALYQGWLATGGTMRYDMRISVNEMPYTSGPPTVFDIAGDTQMQRTVGLNVYNFALSRASNWLGFLTSAGAATTNFTDGMIVTIHVTTADGGTVTYEWRFGQETTTYVPGSAQTQSGQGVPDTTNYAGFIATVNQNGPNGLPDSLRDFAEHLQRMGIPVIRSDGRPVGTVIPGPVIRITCAHRNGQLVCTVHVT